MQSDLDIFCSATYTSAAIDSEAGNEGPDQPALMRWLIKACVVRKLHKDAFRALSIYIIVFTSRSQAF